VRQSSTLARRLVVDSQQPLERLDQFAKDSSLVRTLPRNNEHISSLAQHWLVENFASKGGGTLKSSSSLLCCCDTTLWRTSRPCGLDMSNIECEIMLCENRRTGLKTGLRKTSYAALKPTSRHASTNLKTVSHDPL
jgi:hypothetical protein